MEVCFNVKTKFYRKKMRICIFLTLSIFFVKCAVARSFKAFFILTNISNHIFLKINTCIIKKQKIKNVTTSKILSNFTRYTKNLTKYEFVSGKYRFLGNKLGTPCFRFSEFLQFWHHRNSLRGIC